MVVRNWRNTEHCEETDAIEKAERLGRLEYNFAQACFLF